MRRSGVKFESRAEVSVSEGGGGGGMGQPSLHINPVDEWIRAGEPYVEGGIAIMIEFWKDTCPSEFQYLLDLMGEWDYYYSPMKEIPGSSATVRLSFYNPRREKLYEYDQAFTLSPLSYYIFGWYPGGSATVFCGVTAKIPAQCGWGGRVYASVDAGFPFGSYHLEGEQGVWLHVIETKLECHAYADGAEVSAMVEVSGIGRYGTPFTIDVAPGFYTLTATYGGAMQTMTVEVREGETKRVDFRFAAPPPPPPGYSRVTIRVSGQGTTDPAAGTYTDRWRIGEALYVTAYPASGWRYVKMRRNGVDWTTANPGEFLSLAAEEDIEVVFEQAAPPPPTAAGAPILILIPLALMGAVVASKMRR
jgi:hypothetical protein